MTQKEANNAKVGDTVFYVNGKGAVKSATVIDGRKPCNGIEVGIVNIKQEPTAYYKTWDDANKLARRICGSMSNRY